MNFLLALILLSPPTQAGKLRAKIFHKLCEWNLIGEDPWAYEQFPPEKLFASKIFYLQHKLNSKVIDDEIRRRLEGNLTAQERVLLTSALAEQGQSE